MIADFTYRGEVVVFDLDDTLAAERGYSLSGFRHIARWLKDRLPGLSDPDKSFEVMKEALLSRTPHYDALEKWLNENGCEPKVLMPDLIASVRRHIPDKGYKLREGVKETIELFRRHGIRMGLITDGRSCTQRAKIRTLELEEYIPAYAIFISEERGEDKSKPYSFESMVRLYPEARRFSYIGDNPAKDFLWPNLLGWQTVCLEDTEDSNIHIQESRPFPDGAAVSIRSFKELPGLIL